MANSYSINPTQMGNNPYVMQLAQFANAYSVTDPTMVNSASIFNPAMLMGYNTDLYSMMNMCGSMGIMNPWMAGGALSPQAYNATLTGKNPWGGVYFNGTNNSAWQKYENNRDTLAVGLRTLHNLAVKDEQDGFQTKFNEVLKSQIEMEKTMCEGISNDEAESKALTHINQTYAAMTKGGSLDKTLREHGDAPFVQGLYDDMTLGLFADKTTVSENIALVNNAKLDTVTAHREESQQVLGRITGGAAAVTAGVVASKCPRFLQFAAKKLKGWPAIIAAGSLAIFTGYEVISRATQDVKKEEKTKK